MTGSIRVVHADDDPEFVEVTADFLERADERIVSRSAHDGSAALDLLASTDVDCLVSDYDMPGMTGLDLLQDVRSAFPVLPFILLTGKGSEDLASDAISMGVTDYFRKEGVTNLYPILANRIVTAVESARTKAAAHRFQQLAETFPDVTFYIDDDGRYLEVLAGGANILLTDEPAAIVGQRFHDVLPEATADRFLETVRRALDTGTTQQLEYRLDVEAGPRWFDARIVPLEATQSDRRGVVWAAREITDRKAQERDLVRYRSLVNAMQDPVCIYDTDGRYQLVNQHLVERYGTTEAELLGQPSELVDRIRRESAGDPFQELVDGERDEVRSELTSPSREAVDMEYRLTRLVINGRCEGVVAVSRDVTERNQRRRELERTNDRLEAFASIVSHDLRNPLNVATGRLSLAREAVDDANLEAAETALDRMATLIEDLLALSREGGSVSTHEVVDVGATAETCWQNVDTTDVTLVTDAEHAIRADVGRLKQLLENLFRNAVEHAGDGATVTVGLLDDGFYVADDGPGIPTADRDRVLESGYSSKPGGSGLGLRIVEQIVGAHGWEIAVTSDDSGGTRFEITGVELVP